jgi:DNA-binding CsgD family transcriptional regulator
MASGDSDDSDERSPPVATVVPVSVGGLRGLVIELPVDHAELPTCLTATERDVITLVLEGQSNQEIAEARGASYRTVANQLASIYKKLGVASRTELVARLSSAETVPD